MKKTQLMEAIEKLTQEVAVLKNLDAEMVLEALKQSLISAARKYLDLDKRIDVDIDAESNEVRVVLRVEVVDDYPDYPADATAAEVQLLDEGYLLLDDALEYNEDAQVGDLLELEIPIESFGRLAVQNAKQSLIQKVKEAERDKVYKTYETKIGMIVTGTFTRIEKRNFFISIGKNIEAILPEKGQIRREKLQQGKQVKAVIEDVSDSAKGGSQVILSRTSGRFLAELFRQEVPEIAEGTVEIKAVSRDPGFRAKIAVGSRDGRIDPVGACVGMRGNRVQAIVRELCNERIDIVHWNEDFSLYLRRALAPANIVKMVDVPNTMRTVVIIADADLAQAIGLQGRNVKLASNLVGRVLDIHGESDWTAMSDVEKQNELNPKPTDTERPRKAADSLFRKAIFADIEQEGDIDGMDALAQAGSDAVVEESDLEKDELIPEDRDNS